MDTLVHVGAHTGNNIRESRPFLILKRDEKAIQFLDEDFAGLAFVPVRFADTQRLPRLTSDPLPHLERSRWIGKNDEMLVCHLGSLVLDAATQGGIGE